MKSSSSARRSAETRRSPLAARLCLLVILAAAGFPGAAASSFQDVRDSVDRTVAAAPDGTVTVDCPVGTVRIVGWDRPQVRVSGDLGSATRGLEIDGDEGRTGIRVIYPERVPELDGADLEIRVPRRSRLEVTTLGADVEVAGVDGALSVDSTGGEVTADSGAASLEVESLSGDVELRLTGEGEGRTTRARSASGDVRILGASAEVEASTVSGDLELEGTVLRRARLDSVSGGIRLAVATAPDAILEIENFSGDIELTLPEGMAIRYELDTFSGEIANEFGPRPRRVGHDGPGMELRFSTGAAADGERRLVANTFSGTIRLRRR